MPVRTESRVSLALFRRCVAFLGPVGVAAAAAILSAKRRKQRPHSFETNPSIRKRQQNRLLRKLKVSTFLQINYFLTNSIKDGVYNNLQNTGNDG